MTSLLTSFWAMNDLDAHIKKLKNSLDLKYFSEADTTALAVVPFVVVEVHFLTFGLHEKSKYDIGRNQDPKHFLTRNSMKKWENPPKMPQR